MPKYLLIQNKITMKETVLVTLVADDKQKKNRLLKTTQVITLKNVFCGHGELCDECPDIIFPGQF